MTAAAFVVDAMAEKTEEAAPRRLAAQEDVAGDVEMPGEIEFLMDENDAEPLGVLGAADVDGPAIEFEIAFIGSVKARENLHQSRFAGAVFADDRQHFAGLDVQINLLQCLHAGKGFEDAGSAKERWHDTGILFGNVARRASEGESAH